MALFVQSRPGPLIEPVVVPEIACSGLGRIEFMGAGQGCYVLYRNSVAPATGELERQICGRAYAPLDAMPEAIDLMLTALLEAGRVRGTWVARFLMKYGEAG